MANPHRNVNPHILTAPSLDNLIDSQIWIFRGQIRKNLKFKLWALMHLNLCSSLPCHPSYDDKKYLSQNRERCQFNWVEIESKKFIRRRRQNVGINLYSVDECIMQSQNDAIWGIIKKLIFIRQFMINLRIKKFTIFNTLKNRHFTNENC